MRVDTITVYKTEEGDIRWTRRSAYNGKVIGASTEGYSRVRPAIANIERTQRAPYWVKFVEC
jgi:uncharacterized protein YegP (UPF0339 family)